MQCVYNKHLRCKNTYFVKGEEFISCWGENYAFLEMLAWFFFDDGVRGAPWEKVDESKFKFRPVSLHKNIFKAEIYSWFNDELSPTENNIAYLEPWIKSGALNMSAERLKAIGQINIYMDSLICAILRVAEWRFLDSAFRERGK